MNYNPELRQPLVSIIVATRDRQVELRNCLRSIATQSYKNVEVVIVDNASSDGSLEMVEKEFPSTIRIKLDRNLGCPGGRNIGVLNSTGEYLFFLDDDCIISTDAIHRSLEKFDGEKRPDIVSPAIVEERRSYATPGDPEGIIERFIPVFTGTSAIRRSVFENNGLYPEDFSYGGEESDLSIRLLSRQGRILYCPDVKIYHYPSGTRNRNWELKNSLLNGLQVLWKYAPLPRALLGTLFKPLHFLLWAVRIGAFGGWLGAIPGIPLMILKTLYRRRTPLGWQPFMLSEFLMTNIVTSWDQVSTGEFSKRWLSARFRFLKLQFKKHKEPLHPT